MRVSVRKTEIASPRAAGVGVGADPYIASLRKVARISPADTLTPSERYEELFVAVQSQRIFDDSKCFVDCVPLQSSPTHIVEDFRQEKNLPGFNLERFVRAHFSIPVPPVSAYVSDASRTLRAHIDSLWPVLTRKPREHPAHASLLPLPYPYVVPGGRFTELYYWDSYFTMLGLAASGRHGLLRNMADNFAYLIDAYGHIPNGNRTYYLSRSQPPVFALMVELFESVGIRPATNYLPQLLKEYAYWMDGVEELRPGEVHRHVVRMPDGELLNRYWDDRDSPRDESYLEDIMTARAGSRPVHAVYRDLRAAAESGWDFSSRWLDGAGGLASIRTTAILPVDLNCLLYKLELKIGELSRLTGDVASSAIFLKKASDRQAAVFRYMWDEQQGAFFDYDWQRDRMRPNLTAACAAPLYVGLATFEQAARLTATISARLLKPGGLATTEVISSEQWDRPNGWAPLQWMAIRGLTDYGQHVLADDIACRWLSIVGRYYQREHKLIEKYALSEIAPEAGAGGGGEYPLQDGFGWTNGVTRILMAQFPKHHACRPRKDTGAVLRLTPQ
ncbi:alpha,alpha-trehalase TreF [Noviherbaspirillum aerium]|uniref:alpha,alpha-trehalase TreF n=1 Tax=Noviherbaspirillum aerium TaxID=2588497 RepID=UPI00124E2447|nr:alpha,alpha-trehalase TreF [Noviherbaspirillum aerium]